MSKDTRFKKGKSGNPKGRPRNKTSQAPEGIFDVILDKTVMVTVNGAERELSMEEALEQETLRQAFAGKAMAIRKVIKWIEQRETIRNKRRKARAPKPRTVLKYSSGNADEALRILGIARPDERVGGVRWNIEAWATQAALSRPGRSKFEPELKKEIEFFTRDPHNLHWPKGRVHED